MAIRKKKRVLIVDDEVAIANMLAACCDMWGLEPMVANTAAEALAIVAETRPDLVLTDFMMPGMNGHELVRALRKDRRLSAVPSVLMSAVPDVARRNSPADAFLAKPLDLDEAEQVLLRWSGRRSAGRGRAAP